MTEKRGERDLDLDRLLKDFAASPRAAEIRDMGRAFTVPDDEDLAAYLRGEWPDERARRLRAAILTVPAVARRVARLAGGGLPEEMRDPLPDPLLLLYFADAIPPGPLGDQLRDEIVARFATSSAAERLLDIVQLATIQQDVEQREWLQGLLGGAAAGSAGLVVTGPAEGFGRRARKGAARPAGDRLKGWLVDRDDKLVVDAEGRPVAIEFNILNAHVDPPGQLFVRLLTDDARLVGPAAPPARLRLSLRHENCFLQLPPVALSPGDKGSPYPSASVTIRARLNVDTKVARLASDALVVTVKLETPKGDEP